MAIRFTDLHDKIGQSTMGLITKEQLFKWCDENLEIKSYISISDKYALVKIFSQHFKEDVEEYLNKEDMNYVYMMYDLGLIFDIMFEYIDVQVLYKNRTVENYDFIMVSGFYDYVMSKCGRDYTVFSEMCGRMIGIDNLALILELNSIFAQEPDVESYERIKDIINNEVDQSKLQTLLEIERMNNKDMAKVVDGIKLDVLKETMSGGEGDGAV